MSKEKKLKMSMKAFRAITISVMAVLLAFALVLTIVTDYFTPSLDAFLGKGDRAAKNPSGTSSWDTNYYSFTAKSGDEALKNSVSVAERIADEGEVLLKNNGLLPLSADTAITPMGYRYITPLMSGSGSGGTDTTADYVYDAVKGINEAFTNVNNAAYDAMSKAEPVTINPVAASGEGGQTAFLGSAVSLTEYPASVYAGIEDSCKGTVGIVFMGRAGGEGGDLYTLEYEDGTPHQLALTDVERETLAFAKANCDGVVVILNACNAMQVAELEDDPDIDAIVSMSTPGGMGFKSLGKILNGTVNPSGHTVDTFVVDCAKTPTYVNFNNGTGNTVYENAQYTRDIWLSRFKGGPDFLAPFREYEEGVYMGYRWYETAADLGYFTSTNLPAGVTDPYYNRDNGVVYPFGYGLSYTTFSQEIVDFKADGDEVKVSVKVTNTGSTYAGKDVVQLYYTAPYTEFDVENKIEKPTVNLVEYGKTSLLAPGESEVVELSFLKEDMASYCYTHKNSNGTVGCYVLEEGEYVVSARKNSHEVIDSRTVNVASTFWYDGSDDAHIRESEKLAQAALNNDGTSQNVPADPDSTFIAATNQFEKDNTYMTDPSVGNDVTILTRSDWENTQPTAPTDATRQASATVKEWLDYGYATVDLGHGTWDSVNDPLIGSNEGSAVYVAEMPKSGAKNGVTLSQLRGRSYYDPLWDDLLDQVDYSSSEMTKALFANAFASGPLSSVGKPATVDHDGPQGLALNDNDGNSWIHCCSFPAATMVAQTWNVELAYEMGAAVGEENYFIGGGGWYAPSINMHWSPFSGRNYEYYSEDPVISGKTAAGVISGAGDKGTFCTLKHFAMVDQEEERWWIPSVWATEQTIREIYLKAFEIAVKDATKTIKYIVDDKGTVENKTMRACDAMMASGWSGIGGVFSAYDYNLMTNVLRKEWGFQGYVVTDYDMGNAAFDDVAVNRMVRAGVDQHMLDMTLSPGNYTSLDTATGVAALRQAIKNTLFTQVNSAQFNGAAPGATIYYKMSPWRIAVIVVDVVLGVIILLLIWWNIRRTKDHKQHPEAYKSKKAKA